MVCFIFFWIMDERTFSGLSVSISFSPLSMQSDKSSERVQAESQTGKIFPVYSVKLQI